VKAKVDPDDFLWNEQSILLFHLGAADWVQLGLVVALESEIVD
jgi:hypothetical protein